MTPDGGATRVPTAPLHIARLSVVRLLRERSNLFFVFAFPVLLVLLIGLSFGGASQRIVVVGDSPLADRLATELAGLDDVEVSRIANRDGALDALARGRASAVLVVPDGAPSPASTTQPIPVEVAVRDQAAVLRPAIDAALTAVELPVRAAALAEALGGDGATARELAARGGGLAVTATVVGEDDLAREFAGLGQFDLGASMQLVLFMFITTVSSATRVVESRQLGTLRRMVAAPVGAGQVLLGEGLGRYAIALLQALWIVVASLLLFGVDWGDPLAATVVIAAFGAVSAAAGMLLGAVARDVDQAGGLSTFLGLVLAALGGSMAPLDIFGPTLRVVAHVTPHAWANDAFAELTRRGGGLGDVLLEVAVLLAYAAVVGALAARVLRRRLAASA